MRISDWSSDVCSSDLLDAGLTKAADLVFVAPPTLLEAKKALNACTFPAPHGVDAGLFAQGSDPASEVPGAIADIRHPVVGYHGSIHEWIDLPLIEWLATQRPDWTFLLVGHAAVDVSRLECLPNVVLAGAQPYASLPRWARAYDVAIIPRSEEHTSELQSLMRLSSAVFCSTTTPPT